jgi:hypothetical protein
MARQAKKLHDILGTVCESMTCTPPVKLGMRASMSFLRCIEQDCMPYGPLLAWSWLNGHKFYVPPDCNWPCPDINGAEDWPRVGKDRATVDTNITI